MRVKILTGSLIALLVAGLFLFAAARGEGEDDEYLVRAVFDSASFIAQDMEVRVGGANVGYVEEVDVSMPGEVVSTEDGGRDVPGKAVIVMRITEPGFRDFREDASCIIRPQSLIGEKFVECRPTLPRRPDTEPPPPLEQIEAGNRGEGQYLLPLENNGRMVDFDLVNNIMRRPYSERFRIILNELGGAFAARGRGIEEIVERANPTLREVNRVFGILAGQRRQLAELTAESDQLLEPLARERRRVVGFMRSSGDAAAASAEYSDQIRESFRKFPVFLGEFRQTMAELGGFAGEATPVARDLNAAAPSFTEATEALEPFSDATTTALQSLGEAGEEAGPLFEESRPVVRRATDVARSGARPMYDFSSFLTSTRRTGGFDGLMDLIYNTTAAMNAFDSYGHFARTLVVPQNCLNYATAQTTGCSANFRDLGTASLSYDEMIDMLYARVEELAALEEDGEAGGAESGGVEPGDSAERDAVPQQSGGAASQGDAETGGDGGEPGGAGSEPDSESGGDSAEAPEAGADGGAGGDADGSSEPSDPESTEAGASADLLSYLLGP